MQDRGIDITKPSGQERSAIMEIREVRSVAEFQNNVRSTARTLSFSG